ncbi:MAG: 3-phosphoshikimate 1-carboxyvinyltransferase [Salinivirgaceae bacterium]|nr:3-phosphoshikimate 1-carboxyvinyltransferase [Salinivirgaceae bacterium]
MDKLIFKSSIKGKVNAPPSKSFMQRAIALSVLAEGNTIIENPSRCEDALAALGIARDFGCKVSDDGKTISIFTEKHLKPKILYCGESGLAIRLFTPIVSLFDYPVELEAKGSLRERPADFMITPLKQLKVEVLSNNGFPPITVKGPIEPGVAIVDGSISSQFLSGLLITLPLANGDSSLKVENLKSSPYIDMTIAAIEAFGGKIMHHEHNEYFIKGNQKYKADHYCIEGDWSGAAGLLVAGAIAGEVVVDQLSCKSTQADLAILEALEASGAIVERNTNSIRVKKPDTLDAFEFNALHCPDLFPVLTALAANCKGISKISGVHRLLHKESNRGFALKNEFNKIGIRIDFEDDKMIIEGGKILGGEVFAHNDHRIAFALTLAALNSENPITIEGAKCVKKTYPEFFDDMESLGVKIENVTLK